jgi:ABC-type uncharacterized transport system permease subunit
MPLMSRATLTFLVAIACLVGALYFLLSGVPKLAMAFAAVAVLCLTLAFRLWRTPNP